MLPCGRIPLGLACFGLALFSASLVSGQMLQERQRDLAVAQRLAARAAQQAARLEVQADREGDAAEALQLKAAALAARIQASEAQIMAAEAQLVVIRKKREAARARLAERQRPAIRLVAALQMLGRRPLSLVLIQPQSRRDVVHAQIMLAAIAPEIRRRTAALHQDIEEKRDLEGRFEIASQGLAARQRQLKGQRHQLLRLEAAHRTAQMSLAAGAAAEADRSRALGEEARDLRALVDQLGIEAARQAELAQLPGPVLRPLFPALVAAPPIVPPPRRPSRLAYRLPVPGILMTGFGELEASGARSRGLTLRVPSGAQVVAPARGRVAFAGPFRGYGQIVIIDHGDGWTSLITQLEALDVRVGQRLIAGSPMGRARSRQPAVTVELRHAGQPVDITGFLG